MLFGHIENLLSNIGIGNFNMAIFTLAVFKIFTLKLTFGNTAQPYPSPLPFTAVSCAVLTCTGLEGDRNINCEIFHSHCLQASPAYLAPKSSQNGRRGRAPMMFLPPSSAVLTW